MKKYNLKNILNKKGKEKIVCITAYDAFFAQLLEQLSIDMILVGDSLGNVFQGQEGTIPVKKEDIIYHGKIVAKQAPSKHVIADMPFGSFGISIEETVKNCMDIFKVSGVESVKMEGSNPIILESIRRLKDIGIPVMGHIGFQPQSVNLYGGYRIAGKTEKDELRLLNEANDLYEAGCFSIVLECVIEKAAKKITESIPIPTIGIGAGRFTDGQVLVLHDLLGMSFGKVPSFVRQYADLASISKDALINWIKDVKDCSYPSDKETYSNQ